ncbi:Adenylate cyclase [Diplonema papillatum]|nr:Adenylate cyclase [Diplonema papillatum]
MEPQHYRKPQFRFSALWLIIGAGFVSFVASLCGGMVMYFEGLDILQLTVEEGSNSDLQAVRGALLNNFDELSRETVRYADMVSDYENLNSFAELSKWLRLRAFGDMRTTDVLEAVQVYGFNPLTTIGFQELRWYDPLRDGSRQYVSCNHKPGVNDSATNCLYPCIVCDAVDDYGTRTAAAYNYTGEDDFKDLVDLGNIMQADGVDNMSYWAAPAMWRSPDGNLYGYIGRYTILRNVQNPFFASYVVGIACDFLTASWSDVLVRHETEASMMLLTLDLGLNSVIFAANFPIPPQDPNCTFNRGNAENATNPCLVFLRRLPSDVVDVAVTSNRTTEDVFTRSGPRWLRRLVVHTPRKYDELSAVHLVWFRDVSSVEDKLTRALILLILFIVVVLLFDVFSGVVEILLIARPLKALAGAMAFLDEMNLTEALRAASSCQAPVRLKEISSVQQGFLAALEGLEFYKAFIPNTVFEAQLEKKRKPNPHELQPVSVARPLSLVGMKHLPACVRQIDGEPPGETGRAAIVFTDIQASTAAWDECPLGMKRALKIHNKLIRTSIQEHGGYEVKTIGDSFMVAFTGAFEAVLFAMDVQQSLLLTNEWPDDIMRLPLCKEVPNVWKGLRVRIGVHEGEVSVEINPLTRRADYFGPTVNLAARIEQYAVGGAVILSEHAYLQCDERLQAIALEARFVAMQLGGVELRGCRQYVSLTLLCHEPRTLALETLLAEAVESRMSGNSTTRSARSINPLRVRRDSNVTVSPSLQLPSTRFALSPGLNQGFAISTQGTLHVDYCLCQNQGVGSGEDVRTEPLPVINFLLALMLNVTERTNGCITNGSSGTHVQVSWGAPVECVSHVQSAVYAVGLFYSQFSRQCPWPAGAASFGLATGKVVFGSVGSQDQRFVIVAGEPKMLSVRVARFASQLRINAAVASMPKYSNVGCGSATAWAAGAIRPIAYWSVFGSEVVVYEIRPSKVLHVHHNSGIVEESTEWDWSRQYDEAFYKKDTAAIVANASDKLLQVVASQMQHKPHEPRIPPMLEQAAATAEVLVEEVP